VKEATKVNVTVWNEYRHEREQDAVRAVYPAGIHTVVAEALTEGIGAESVTVRTATLDEPEHGLPNEVLNATDVLFWWGHGAHEEVSDEIVDRVVARVLDGMGLVVLHSGHYSKVFKRLMGTSCALKWRDDDRERLWVVAPGHPIVAGVPEQWELSPEEMYGEHFDIPEPDELVLVSWFAGGEVFRSGCCYNRGRGRIFYFRPGHESFPTYYDPTVRRVMVNAARWAAPTDGPNPVRHNVAALERPTS
jgi:trehalose utilization protein